MGGATHESDRTFTGRHEPPRSRGSGVCFAVDYRNETPAHPERAFTGREQVRRNWEQIFAAIPDVSTDVVSWAAEGELSGVNGSTAAPVATAVPT